MKRSVLLSLLLLLCLAACGMPEADQAQKDPSAHTHAWEPANCSRGEYCFGCGQTQGEALSHNWVEATCQKEKHCALCGERDGNLLPHTSDGSGTCTLCKQKLNIYMVLDGARPEKKGVVYGGVVLRFPFNDTPDHLAYSGMFGKDYRIYDQSGALVAEGEWCQKVPVIYLPATSTYNPNYHDTAYIPLSPGTYRIEYGYYELHKVWLLMDENNRVISDDLYLIPESKTPEEKLQHSSNMLEVR